MEVFLFFIPVEEIFRRILHMEFKLFQKSDGGQLITLSDFTNYQGF